MTRTPIIYDFDAIREAIAERNPTPAAPDDEFEFDLEPDDTLSPALSTGDRRVIWASGPCGPNEIKVGSLSTGAVIYTLQDYSGFSLKAHIGYVVKQSGNGRTIQVDGSNLLIRYLISRGVRFFLSKTQALTPTPGATP